MTLLGNNGILNMVLQAKNKYNAAEEDEKQRLDNMASLLVATGDNAQVTLSLEDLKTLIKEEGAPTGTVISYMGNKAPAGYLSCDGAIYNISDYSELAEQIKTEFGSYNYYGGDGTTTFAVPNLKGEFLRGTGTNSHTDQGSGTSVGKHQDSTTIPAMYVYGSSKNLTMRYDNGDLGDDGSYAMRNVDKMVSLKGNIGGTIYSGSSLSSTMTGASFGVRPTNTSVLYCIKY